MSDDIQNRTWPEWLKNLISAAVLGVPIVLWLAATHAAAMSASDVAHENQTRIRELEKTVSREEARWESVVRGMERLEAAIGRLEERIVKAEIFLRGPK